MSINSVKNDTIAQDSVVSAQKPIPPTISGYSISGLDDTALDPAGGQTVLINGTGFQRGATITFDGSAVSVVTWVSSNQLSFTAPAKSAGTYTIYVVNIDGGTAIYVPGVVYSSFPTWTTGAGTLGSYYETQSISNTVVASGDAPLTYSLYSGSLPTGASLSSSGVITGTAPADTGSTTYSFTIQASDAQLQDSTRSFSLTINTDVVSWTNPSSNTSISLDGTAYSNALSASSAAGGTISYSANSLPTGLSLSSGTISGTPTVDGTSTTLLTATASPSTRTAQRTITWTVSLGDTYWKSVSMLLNGNTPTTTFINDASLNNAQLTIVGDTRLSNFNPYQQGYYSYYFGTKSNYVSVPSTTDITTLTGDFTIESWVYPIDTSIEWIVMDARTNGATAAAWLVSLSNYSSGWNLRFYNGTANDSTSRVQPYVWSHIAVVRVGSTITHYINGVASGTATVSGTITGGNSTVFIGGKDSGLSGYGTVGNISNLRIVNGSAVYTSNFTPPTSPLTAIANTKLLVANSCRHIDSSAKNATLTNSGTVVSAANPFTTPTTAAYNTLYSAYFNGPSDYLSMQTGNSVAFGTGDFCVEMWIYATKLDSVYVAFDSRGGGTGMCFFTNGATFNVAITGNSNWFSNVSISLNTWYHVAVTRESSTARLFINGVLTSSGTQTTNFGSNFTYIGVDSYSAGAHWFGNISNVRVVKGSAVYTSSFTPSTTPLTAITNTVLLTCQNSTFIDNSTNAFAITSYSNARPVAVSPFTMTTANTTVTTLGSAYLDGSGDYITAADSNAYSFGTGDFTVEAWIYITTGGRGNGIWTNGTAASGSLGLTVTSSNTLRLDYYGGTSLASTGTVAIGQWQHVAAVRSGSNLYLYINGVRDGSTTTTSNNTSSKLAIGDNWYGYNTTSTMTGYMTDLRVTKGTALYTSNFLPPQISLTAVANTQLLTCQTNGGATNNGFVDQSSLNNIITRNGNPTQGTFSPYSQTGWSNYFDGTGDYLSFPNSNNLAFGTGSFTIEFWINAPLNNDKFILGGRAAIGSMHITTGGYNSTAGVLRYTDGTNTTLSSVVITDNTWHHCAIVRNGSSAITLYVDGVSVGTGTDSTNYTTTTGTWYIGSNDNFPNSNILTGYISNLRVIKGTALYTTTFTPSTTPLTAVSGTSLLTCQSNRLVDNSPNNITITRNGDVSVQAFSPFGGVTSVPTSYSNYFDGTGDRITVPGNTAYAFGTGNFTIELWVYPTAYGTYLPYASQFFSLSTGVGSWFFGVNATGGHEFYHDGQTYMTFSGRTVSLNKWQHIALVRNGTTVTLYIDGQSAGTGTSSSSIGTSGSVLEIGGSAFNTSYGGIGYISNLRILKGTALYTTTFTPPTSPLTVISNTSILTCQSNKMIDNSTNYATITAVGDTKVYSFNPFGLTNTTQVSYSPSVNGGSMYFDGTGDYLYTPSLTLGGNFTIELWYYYSSGGSYRSFVTTRNSTSDETGSTAVSAVFVGLNGNSLYYDSYNTQLTGSGTVVQNVWNHIACVRSGSTVTLYLNGVSQGTVSDATAKTARPVYIGGLGSIYNLIGYMSDFKMTPGVALYTANFYPGAAPVTSTATIGANTYSSGLYLTGTSGGIIDYHSTNNLETVGDVKLAPEDPYSGSYYSNYFDGTGDYLTAAATALPVGSANYTIESWFNSTSAAKQTIIFWGTGSSNQSMGFSVLSNGSVFNWWFANDLTTTGVNVLDGAWHHLVATFNGTTRKIYVDGVQRASDTPVGKNTSGTNATIGYQPGTGGETNYVTGYISNLRVVAGLVYDISGSTITVPTSPLTAVASTSLLTCQSKNFVDNSTNAFAITRNGDVAVKSKNPFQQNTGKSLYFDGSGDYLYSTNITNSSFGTGDFTMECWVYFTSIASDQAFIGSQGSGGFDFAWRTANGLSIGRVNTAWDSAFAWSPTAGQWYHVAYSRSGSSLKAFVNGTQVGSTATNTNSYSPVTSIVVGASTNVPDRPLLGYLKDLRLTRGIARYTTTFTPPTTTVKTN